MLAMENLRNTVPPSNLIPINWKEIAQALQTLWMRKMSNPVRAIQAAAEHNRRLFETTMDVWNDAAARFWGFPQQKEVGKPDKRFSAPEWDANPYYQTLKQMYLLASDYLLKEAEGTSGGEDTAEERRLKFHLKQFVDAMAPVNFLLTNPTALKRIMETGGSSITEGARNLLSDLKEGRVSMTDANAFKPGENLAITPGKVIYRNELIELIQYAPQTQQVFQTPILFIPPWINKYYILDLRPENSMIRYMVEQGFTVFIISWKNPDASMEDTGFDDYMTLGPLAAVDAIRDITGSDKVNPVGYCIGGTLLAVTLAWLAAGHDRKAQAFGATTFMVSMQDFAEVGESEHFMDEPQFELMENQMMRRGYLDQNTTSNMFNLLRSSDLIWANVINNYLLGQKPPAFDMLYWNADGTRMARAAHSFYIRNTYLENNLIEPGKVMVKGRPIDLSKIGGEIYAVGAEKDHIVPWASAWRIGQLVNGKVRFVLASSGHIAGMINPPAKGKGKHWVNEDSNTGSAASADEWRKNASEHEGSWWVDWKKWLESHSGNKVKPPSVGSENYPPMEEAPGIYVKEK
ncbi:MAG TPA: class I poly(R)-hydroxyalkanoic acid synthase [Gammaproteobacteria bacterium]|nr:class I poly(R)-hydroxyalkanoic acid synthase [Gammaproteobacteria bacterium]